MSSFTVGWRWFLLWFLFHLKKRYNDQYNVLWMVVSAAPDAQRSRFSTVIDHDLIVCGRFLPGEASQRQDNVLYLIYNKQGSALASNWWGKASFHSRIFLSVLQLLRSFLFSFFTPSLTQTFVSDFLLPDSAVLMPNQHLELVFLVVVWAHLWNWTLVLKWTFIIAWWWLILLHL